MEIYAALSKIEEQDDGTLLVSGVASTEARDAAGEVVTADAMKAALPDYMQFPALREMHGLSAAGTTMDASVGDDNITRIVVKVVDPVAVAKVNSGTYRGFSIGGKVKARDPKDRTVVTKIDLREISLVDRPCNPEARLDMWKADAGQDDKESDMTDVAGAPAPEPAGAAEAPTTDQAAAAVEAPEVTASAGTPDASPAAETASASEVVPASADEAAAKADALSLAPASEAPAPADRAAAAVASLEAAVAKASGAADLAKSLYTIGDFADLLISLSYLVQDAEFDALFNDDSPVPEKLRDAVNVLAGVFKEMAAEEADKLISAGKAKKAAEAEAIGKAAESGTLAKAVADAVDLRQAVADRDEQLAKLADRVEPLIKTVTDLSQRLAKVEAEPAPPKTAGSTLAKAVTKEEDAGGHGAAESAPTAVTLDAESIAKVLAAMPEDERNHSIMKAALARPMPLKL